MEEVIVNGQNIDGKENIAQAVREFWESIGGMNDAFEWRHIELSLTEGDMTGLNVEITSQEVGECPDEFREWKSSRHG